MKLLLNSIYRGTEGEGVRIGIPQIFVRLQGCTISCRNCDSKDTWSFDPKTAVSLESILTKIYQTAKTIEWVSITGGDPLDSRHREGLLALIYALKKNYKVNLEASGTVFDTEVFDILDYISFDYKTPSTGVYTNLDFIFGLANKFPGKFQIKSVIATEEDFNYTYSAYKRLFSSLDNPSPFPWCLTPAWERRQPFNSQCFQKIIELNESLGGPFRVIGQQHKWVYGPERINI